VHIQIGQKQADVESFMIMRGQFFQSLLDNFEQRFPAAEFLQAVGCLNPLMWPDDPLQRAHFGEKFVAELCKCFLLSSCEAALIVVDYAVFKQSCGAVTGKSLQQLLHLLDVLPVSSADCERG
jgi:hypothetical protein